MKLMQIHNIVFFYNLVGLKSFGMAHRVLGFFSSRSNWDPPPPPPAGECVLSPLWGSTLGRGDRHCGTLGTPIYVGTFWYVPLLSVIWQVIPAWLVGADVQPDLGAGHLILSSLQLRCRLN